jgi:hypothetical protein
MPTLLLTESDAVRAIPLAPATLVGRAPACLARVGHPSCPAHWLELRWRPEGWAWRPLAAADRTYGSGAFLHDGWRALDARDGQGTRVRLTGTSVQVELVEGGAPRPFAWDVLTDEPLDGEALDEVAEVRADALLPLSAEGDDAQALRDGQCWVHVAADGTARTLRAHVPTLLAPTLAPRIDVSAPGLTIEIDLAGLAATFTQREVAVTVRGECVRVLAVFAQARQQGEGWLDASEAWARWVELGGTRETALDRMSWERGKLRAQLARQRVSGLDGLFARRKVGAFVHVRLAVEPGAIFFAG